MYQYSDSLNNLIKSAGISDKSAFSTGETARILSISRNMVIMLCDRWEPDIKDGIECYRTGSHRRIPYHSLLFFLEHNSNYNVQGSI